MPSAVIIISIIFQISLILFPGAAEKLDPSQYAALKRLYETTGGENWHWKTPEEVYGVKWNFSDPSSDPCQSQWQGVNCTSAGQSMSHKIEVVELILEHFNLLGNLDEYIFANMTSLLRLSFKNSLLSGELPSSIPAIRNLNYLDLSANSFTGNIPIEFGNMTSLQYLNLQNNSLH